MKYSILDFGIIFQDRLRIPIETPNVLRTLTKNLLTDVVKGNFLIH